MAETILAAENIAVEYKRPGLRATPNRVIHDVSFEL